MKKLTLLLILIALQIFVGCNLLKDLNNVTQCSEPGLFVDLNKKGDYRVNGNKTFENKKVTRKMADSICIAINLRNKK